MSSKKNMHYWLIMALAFAGIINTLSITGAISHVAAAVLLILDCVAIGTVIVVMTHRKKAGKAKTESDPV